MFRVSAQPPDGGCGGRGTTGSTLRSVPSSGKTACSSDTRHSSDGWRWRPTNDWFIIWFRGPEMMRSRTSGKLGLNILLKDTLTCCLQGLTFYPRQRCERGGGGWGRGAQQLDVDKAEKERVWSRIMTWSRTRGCLDLRQSWEEEFMSLLTLWWNELQAQQYVCVCGCVERREKQRKRERARPLCLKVSI